MIIKVSKRSKRLVICLGVVILLLIVLVSAVMYNMHQTTKALNEIVIQSTPLKGLLLHLPDGEYIGQCTPSKMVGAKVKVIVKDHSIHTIDLLEHNTGKGKPAEIIPDQVVKAQSLAIDAVSGATGSSKVILKAIENALKVP